MTDPTTVEDRPFRRRMLVNTAAVGLSNGWAMVVALVSLPLVLSGLGPVAFGTWALLTTFSAVSGWLSLLDLGLGTAATRQLADRHARHDADGMATTVGTTVVLHAALGVGAGALLAVVGPWVLPTVFNTPDDLVSTLRVAIVAFGAQVALDLTTRGFQAVLDGYQRVDRARVVDVVRRTAVAAATSAAALVTEDLAAVAVASAAATALGVAVAAAFTRIEARGHRPRWSSTAARELFAYGKTVAVLRPLGVVHRTIDRFIVGAVLGPAAVTLVEVAAQLQAGADAVLSATSYAVVPGSARLHARGDRSKLVELAETGTRYVLLATWPVAALTAVLAGPAIDVWVGAEYSQAATLVALAALAVALAAPAQVGSNLLLGTGRAASILRVALVGIAINVVATVALVEAVGVEGAFVATVVAAAVSLPLLIVATVRHLEVAAGPFLRHAVAPALAAPAAAAAAGGAVVLADLAALPTLLVGGAAGTVAAAAAALRWGLQPHERAAITARLRRRGAAVG